MLKKITKKAFAKLVAARKRRNAAFARMSAANKRVIVAKDVLEQLRSKKIKATNGTYFEPTQKLRENERMKILGKDLSDALPMIPSCNVCAIGSLFKCVVERADKVKVVDASNATGAADEVEFGHDGVVFTNSRAYLTSMGIFTDEQLALMENAFESQPITGKDNGSAGVHAFPFREDFGYFSTRERGSSKDRLRLIMENVVRNKGTYVPDDPKFLVAAKKLPINRPLTKARTAY